MLFRFPCVVDLALQFDFPVCNAQQRKAEMQPVRFTDTFLEKYAPSDAVIADFNVDMTQRSGVAGKFRQGQCLYRIRVGTFL